jgi:hypothetical protein
MVEVIDVFTKMSNNLSNLLDSVPGDGVEKVLVIYLGIISLYLLRYIIPLVFWSIFPSCYGCGTPHFVFKYYKHYKGFCNDPKCVDRYLASHTAMHIDKDF